MSQRTIKNYTDQDFVLNDLGDIIIPANGALDIGGNESRLIELANSEDLLEILSLGISSCQLNDGLRDMSKSEGIDIIRKIQRPTEIDELGRWVVRSDSRKKDWDIVFQGAGDGVDGVTGSGTPFMFDLSAAPDDPRWDNENAPTGFKMQTVDWQFNDWTFLKEGTMYFYDMPKGSYINFSAIAPPGTGYMKKVLDENQSIVATPTATGSEWIQMIKWVINYRLEGSCPMGDELNTESATENPAPPYFVWRFNVCVPDVTGWENAHGHWTLEAYRMSMGLVGPHPVNASKMITWPPA